MTKEEELTLYTRKQVAKHKSPDDCWIIIENGVYDVTKFISKHPGGRYIVDAAGKDATAVFISTHLFATASHLLKSQPFCDRHLVGRVELDEKNDYHWNDSFYMELKQRVAQHFQKSKIKPSQNNGIVLWYLGFLALNVAASAYFFLWGGYCASVFLGLTLGLTEVNIMHSANHGAIVPNSKWSMVLNHLLDLAGQSCWAWRKDHNLAHHQYTGSEFDTEKKQQPFLRLHPSQQNTFFSSLQDKLYPILLMFHVPFSNLSDVGRICSEYRQGDIQGADLAGYIFGKCAYMAFFWAAPMMVFGLMQGFLYSIAAHLVGGSYITLSLITNHTTEQCDNYNTPQGRSWGKTQVACAANLHSGNRLVNFLTGGLSQQVEHHLFPALPPCYLPEIAPIVQDVCRKQGVPYPNFKGVFSLWSSFHQRMKSLAQDDEESKPAVKND